MVTVLALQAVGYLCSSTSSFSLSLFLLRSLYDELVIHSSATRSLPGALLESSLLHVDVAAGFYQEWLVVENVVLSLQSELLFLMLSYLRHRVMNGASVLFCLGMFFIRFFD